MNFTCEVNFCLTKPWRVLYNTINITLTLSISYFFSETSTRNMNAAKKNAHDFLKELCNDSVLRQ